MVSSAGPGWRERGYRAFQRANPGDIPVRLYTIVAGHKAVDLVFHTGGLAY